MPERSPIVGLRLEDKSRWERRTPLVPADIVDLRAAHDLDVVVQPSPVRIYDDDAYRSAGARIDHDLDGARVVLGVKEVPIDKLLPNRAYCFFAHVIKGQAYNMPLLRAILERRITLIDYEKIEDASGHRLVKFGREAGQAGMLDSLWTLGQRLAREGRPTPLEAIRPAHRYRDLADAVEHLREIGRRIRTHGLDPGDGPLVLGLTGGGSVTRGAREVLGALPIETVEAEALPGLVDRPERDRLFEVVFEKRHLAAPADGSAFDDASYRSYPERFRGRLHDWLPHLHVLIHGVFWTERYPRFVTRQQVRDLWRAGQRRLRVIGDITCDIDGSIELTVKATQPDKPTYVYRPEHDDFVDGLDGEGVCVLAVDNLPCELPRDASDQFSRSLRPFVAALALADYDVSFAELNLPDEIRRAVVTHRGELTPAYRYLDKALSAVKA